jgi:hypothetical protein
VSAAASSAPARARRGHPRPHHRADRAARPGQRHQSPQQQADPRRPALPRDARLRLVREALQERGLLLTRLAPHLVRPVPFLYPLTHRGWERPYVGAGLALYDAMAMAGKYDMGLPRHRHLSASRSRGSPGPAQGRRPRARSSTTTPGRRRPAGADGRPHRRGHGAHVATRVKVIGFLREGERVVGVRAVDLENGRELEVRARVGRQRGRRLDRRDPGDGRRRGAAPRPGQQGHPPRRAARPDPLRDRASSCAPRSRCSS